MGKIYKSTGRTSADAMVDMRSHLERAGWRFDKSVGNWDEILYYEDSKVCFNYKDNRIATIGGRAEIAVENFIDLMSDKYTVYEVTGKLSGGTK